MIQLSITPSLSTEVQMWSLPIEPSLRLLKPPKPLERSQTDLSTDWSDKPGEPTERRPGRAKSVSCRVWVHLLLGHKLWWAAVFRHFQPAAAMCDGGHSGWWVYNASETKTHSGLLCLLYRLLLRCVKLKRRFSVLNLTPYKTHWDTFCFGWF